MALIFMPFLFILMLLGAIYFMIPEGEFLYRADVLSTLIRCIIFLFPMICLFSAIYVFRNKLFERIFII